MKVRARLTGLGKLPRAAGETEENEFRSADEMNGSML
jgi:hypothetical protein